MDNSELNQVLTPIGPDCQIFYRWNEAEQDWEMVIKQGSTDAILLQELTKQGWKKASGNDLPKEIIDAVEKIRTATVKAIAKLN